MRLDPEEHLNESFLSQKPLRKAFAPAVLFALAATAASVVSWLSDQFREAWIGNPESIFGGGEWYRLFTSILLHAEIRHLLSNMAFLILFGGLLTNYFGWRVFPAMGIAVGLVTQYLSLKTYPSDANLLGASGLLYVLFGLWLSLYYRAETHLTRTHRLLRILGFGLVMFVPSQFSPTVSYRTHYIGLALGLAAGAIYGFFWKEPRHLSSRLRP
jgi:rhomboid protease GluP